MPETRFAPRFALLITGWLASGWLVAALIKPVPGELSWWLLMGLPFSGVLLVLALGFAAAIIGLAVSLLKQPRKPSATRR